MSENDYIAEYVKEKRPEIIHTLDFHFWKFGRVIKNVGDTIAKVFKKDKEEGEDEDDKKCGHRPDVCGEGGEDGEEDTYSEWSGWNSETDET